MNVSVLRSPGPGSTVLFKTSDLRPLNVILAPEFDGFRFASTSIEPETAKKGKKSASRLSRAITGVRAVNTTGYNHDCLLREGNDFGMLGDKDYPRLNR